MFPTLVSLDIHYFDILRAQVMCLYYGSRTRQQQQQQKRTCYICNKKAPNYAQSTWLLVMHESHWLPLQT